MSDTIDDWVKVDAPKDDWVMVGAPSPDAAPAPKASSFPSEEPGYTYGDLLPLRWKQGADGTPQGLPELAWPRTIVRGMQETDARITGPLTPGKMQPTGPDLFGLTGLGALGGGGAAPRPTFTVRPMPADAVPPAGGGPVVPVAPAGPGGAVPLTDFQRLVGGGGEAGGASGRQPTSMAPRLLPELQATGREPPALGRPAAAAASETVPPATMTSDPFAELMARPIQGGSLAPSEPPVPPRPAVAEAPPAPPAAPATAPTAVAPSAPVQGVAPPLGQAPAVTAAIQSLRTTMADPRTPQQIAQETAADERARLSEFQAQLPEGWTIGQQPGAGYVLTDPIGATVPVSTAFPTAEDFGRAADIGEQMMQANAPAYEAALRRGDGTPAAPVHVQRAGDIAAAADRTAAPSPGQAEAGNYRMGHVKLGGLNISIENAAGTERHGIGPDGTPWSATLPVDYGYIKRTKGADGDHIDVYLGPQAHEAQQHPVFVIDQKLTDGPGFDETKSMIGFPSRDAALHAYRSAFSDGKGHDRIGAVTAMPWGQFRQWVSRGNHKKPVAYKPATGAEKRRGGRVFTGPLSLFEFIASKGGIRDQGGELRSIGITRKFIPGLGALVRPNGMPLDRAREAAEEAGYLKNFSTIVDLLEAMDEEARGRRQYSNRDAGDIEAAQRRDREDADAERAGETRAEVVAWAAKAGMTSLRDDEVDAAVRLVLEKGTEPGDAIVEVLERSEYGVAATAQMQVAAAGKEISDALEETWDGLIPDEYWQDDPGYAADREQPAGGQPGDTAGGPQVGQPAREGVGGEHEGRGGAEGDAGGPDAGQHDQPRPGAAGQGIAAEAGVDDWQPAVEAPPPSVKSEPAAIPDKAPAIADKPATIPNKPQTERVDTVYGTRDQGLLDGVAPLPGVRGLPKKPEPPKQQAPGGMFDPGVVDQTDLVGAFADQDRAKYGSVAAPNTEALAQHFREMRASGKKLVGQQALYREAARLLGGPVMPGSRAAQAVDQALHQSHQDDDVQFSLAAPSGAPKRTVSEAERRRFNRVTDAEISRAKFILPDGRLLAADDEAHEYVANKLGYGTRGEDAVADFMAETGAIRIGIAAAIFDGSGDVSIPARPTEAQMAKLAKYVNAHVAAFTPPVVTVSYAGELFDVRNGGELRRAIDQQDDGPRLDVPGGWGSVEPGPEQLPDPKAIEAALKAVRHMTGGKVDVDVTDGLLRTTTGTERAGGVAIGRVIRAALSARTPTVLRHEGIHALRNLGVISPAEWKALEAAARREDWIGKHGITKDGRYSWLTEEKQIEEAIAEHFAQWETDGGPKGGMLHRAFQRVGTFLTRAANALHGRGFQTAADVFGKVEAGEVGAREPGSEAPQRGPQTIEEALARLALFDQFDGMRDGSIADLLADIRFSMPPQPGLPLGQQATFASPAESWLDDAIYELQDKGIDTKRVIANIEAVSGQLDDARNPYLGETLYHGRVAKQTADFLRDEMKPLLTEMARREVSIEDFDRALWARHAEERNQQIARINPRMPDGGSGLKTADAHAILAGYTPEQLADFDALGKMVDEITRKSRDLLVWSGLEGQATVNAWNKSYEHYVPLMRADMEGIGASRQGQGTGQGFSVKGPASKRAMGSDLEVVNILANIAMQRERSIVRGEKNKVANELVALVRANPNPDFWTLNQATERRVIDPATGLVVSVVDGSYKSDDNVVVARRAGTGKKAGEVEEQTVTFNPSSPRAMRMAMATKNLDMDELKYFFGLWGMATRWLARMNTQYNPYFGIKNLVRDSWDGMLNQTSTKLAGKQIEVMKLVPSAIRGIMTALHRERGGKPHSNHPMATLWERFQDAGAQTGYKVMWNTSADRARALEKEIKAVSAGRLRRFGSAMADYLSFYNETLENAVRLSAFKVALDQGMTVAQAANLAKNLTVNFNRKGARGTQIGAIFAFYNARVQGTARTLETLSSPKGGHTAGTRAAAAAKLVSAAGKMIISGGVMLGAIQGVMLAGYTDAEIPQFERETNLIIPTPGASKPYVKIPLPLNYSVLASLGRVPVEIALGGGKDAGKKLAALVGTAFNAASPIGQSGMSIGNFMPTVIAPIVSVAENKSWTGVPIARESMSGLDPKPGHALAKATASEPSKWVSKAINILTGGTEFTPGGWSPTPDQLDYLAGQYGGGATREVIKTEQAIASLFTGEELPTNRIPLVSGFLGTAASPPTIRSAFFEHLKEINAHEAELKGRTKQGNYDDAKGYKAAHPLSEIWKAADLAQKAVANLEKDVRNLKAKGASKGLIKQAEAKVVARMKFFNDFVDKRSK